MNVYIIQENGVRVLKVFRDPRAAKEEHERLNAESKQHGGDIHYKVRMVEVEPVSSVLNEFFHAKATANEAFRIAFAAGCAALFDAHPELQSFGWWQYTAVIEDSQGVEHSGRFIVDYDVPDVNGIQGPEVGDDDNEGELSMEATLQCEVSEFLSIFADDASDMRAHFGDDVHVTVYRNQFIQTDSYPRDQSDICPDCGSSLVRVGRAGVSSLEDWAAQPLASDE